MLDIITRKEIKLKQGLSIPKQIFKMVKGYWKGIKRTFSISTYTSWKQGLLINKYINWWMNGQEIKRTFLFTRLGINANILY